MGIALDLAGGRMYWTEIGVPRLRSAMLNGSDIRTIPVPAGVPTGIFVQGTATADASQPTPSREFALDLLTSNPMMNAATMAFSLPGDGLVRIAVFDVRGREVARLAEGHCPAGSHLVAWDGQCRGARAAGGVYFVRCEWAGKAITRRLALL
jgi:hypothetical protein